MNDFILNISGAFLGGWGHKGPSSAKACGGRVPTYVILGSKKHMQNPPVPGQYFTVCKNNRAEKEILQWQPLLF